MRILFPKNFPGELPNYGHVFLRGSLFMTNELTSSYMINSLNTLTCIYTQAKDIQDGTDTQVKKEGSAEVSTVYRHAIVVLHSDCFMNCPLEILPRLRPCRSMAEVCATMVELSSSVVH